MIIRKNRFLLVLAACLVSAAACHGQSVEERMDWKIRFNFRRAEIGTVLRYLNEMSGLTIINTTREGRPAVSGEISIQTPGKVTVREALAMMETSVQARGFTGIRSGNTLRLVPLKEAKQNNLPLVVGNDPETAGEGDEVVTQIVYLDYITSDKAKELVEPYLSTWGHVAASDDSNALIIVDTRGNIKRMLTMIDKVADVSSRQVFIKGLIAEVILDGDLSMGVEWLWKDTFTNLEGNPDLTGSIDADVSFGLKGGTSGFTATIATSKVENFINFLSTKTHVNVLAAPRLLTMNNVKARFIVGQKVPFLTGTTTSAGGNETHSYNYQDVGTELEVTPHITEGGMVTMNITQSDKKISSWTDFNAALVDTRELTTQVMVRDGETIVLGGLMEERKSVVESRVPILGSLPLLGIPFRSKRTTSNKTEMLVFLTPYVVTDEVAARELSEKERDRINPRLLKKSFRKIKEEGGEEKQGEPFDSPSTKSGSLGAGEAEAGDESVTEE